MTTWARLAKSILASAGSLEIGVVGQGRPVGRHAITASGDLLFSLAEAAPACVHLVTAGTGGPDVLATAADVSTVPCRDRVRGVVRLGGRADVLPRPVDEQLRAHLGVGEDGLVGRLVPTSVTLDWRVEVADGRRVEHVAPEDYAAATVDALAGWQDGWVAHLAADHGPALGALVADRTPGTRVRPVHADEFGLVLREYGETVVRDVRVPFPERVSCGCEAVAALKHLLATHARR